jgi:hypothetical protein
MDQHNAAAGQLPPSCPCCTADPTRRAALARIQAQRDYRAVCRWLDELAPLTVYYGPRPLRIVGLSQFLAEGRWAA